MSDGWPKYFVSSGSIRVSKVVPSDAYSASVNPPTGFRLSATTIAFFVIATTRPARNVGAVQSLSAFALSVRVWPTLTLAGMASWMALPTDDDGAGDGDDEFILLRCQLRAPAASRPIRRRSRPRSASSND